MVARRVGDNAGAERRAQFWILHDDVKRVVDLGSFPLVKGCRVDRLRLAEEDQGAVDEVRAKVPENAGGWKFRLFAPGARLGVEAKAVEAGFVFGDLSKSASLNQFFYGEECAVPAAVLIDADQEAAFCGEAD